MKVIYDGEGEDVTNGEASGEVTVGVGVNKNDFGVKAIDDGKGEDVTNGEGVNVKDLGDGEADDGDNNEGDLFFCHVIHHIPPLFHHDSLKLGVVSIFYFWGPKLKSGFVFFLFFCFGMGLKLRFSNEYTPVVQGV